VAPRAGVAGRAFSTSVLATDQVVEVGAEAEGAKIYIAYPEHLRSSGKIRALTVWLQKRFADPTDSDNF